MKLFRDEAVAAHGTKYGRPIAQMPTTWKMLTVFFVIFGCVTAAFLSVTRIARKETASGVLALSKGELRITPPKFGIITDIYVTDGQRVEVGDPLVRVSTEQDLAGNSLNQELAAAVARQKEALTGQLAAFDASAPGDRAVLGHKLAAGVQEIGSFEESLASALARLDVAKRAVELGRQGLASGSISGDNLRRRESEYLSQRQLVSEIQARLADLRGNVAQHREALAKLATDQDQTRSQLRAEIAALDSRAADVTGTLGYVIKSKISGHVTALQAKIGQGASHDRPLLTLVPEGSELRAEVYVPSRAIAFVKVGQRVRLIYDAFPIERFGAAYGSIVEISNSVLRPDEIGAVVSVDEPVYRVLVKPDRVSVNAYASDVPLRAGMAFIADIVLEDRSLLNLMLDPLSAARGRTAGADR